MRIIKLNNTDYKLVDHENVMPTFFQATIFKESYTMEKIAQDVKNTETIEVYMDEELVATYEGYTDVRVISMYQNNEDMVVSIELDNHNVYSMINNVSEELESVEEVQDAHTNNLSELNIRVADITPYTDTKVGYYGETYKVFYNVPFGNVSVFFDNYNGAYTTSRLEDRLYVYFDALEHETNITISIV